VATYRDVREIYYGKDHMKIKDATDKANEALSGAAAKVERAGLTKWILVALGVVLLILIGVWASAAHATGWHHAPVVPPKVVIAPPVAAPPPAAVPPAAPPPATPAPQSQPSGSGPGAVSWVVFGAVVVYFANVIRVHWIACAQREEQWHKDNKVARCYNAERDGLPR
jgi:hypothetical protein